MGSRSGGAGRAGRIVGTPTSGILFSGSSAQNVLTQRGAMAYIAERVITSREQDDRNLVVEENSDGTFSIIWKPSGELMLRGFARNVAEAEQDRQAMMNRRATGERLRARSEVNAVRRANNVTLLRGEG